MGTDAGFAPRMELIGGKQDFGNRLPWRKQKSGPEMNAALARQFYGFKRIQWIEFGTAAALARTTGTGSNKRYLRFLHESSARATK